jgi:two-component system, OmpR family, KDP operon response regulator KdpE
MSENSGKILIVDDEYTIRVALRTTLGALGFETKEARNGEEAICRLQEQPADVILLDINMPGMGGLQACKELRRLSPRVGIIMLTVRDTQLDKVEALDAGADDYVVKPFPIQELLARLRAAVRRAHTASQEDLPVIRIGDIELDATKRTVRKAGQPIRLTPKEFDLLQFLMAHAGVPLLHVRLLQTLWGPEYGGELEYLRTFVRSLRKKIEDDPAHPTYLLTDPYVGYRFRDTQP